MKKITQLIVFCVLFVLGVPLSGVSEISAQESLNAGPGGALIMGKTVEAGVSMQRPMSQSASRMFACQGILAPYSNLAFNGGSRASQNFTETPLYDAFDNEAADDFLVPGSASAYICEIDVYGVYTSPTDGPAGDPAATFSLNIYSDAGGPGALIFSETFLGTTVDPDNDGIFTLSPSTIFPLAGGTTYWVSVVANMEFDGGTGTNTGGQWFWGTTSDGNGSEYVWQNPGDGFGTGATTWAPASGIFSLPPFDLNLDIRFNLVNNPPVAVCQDIDVFLDAAGNATIMPSAIDGGSTDIEDGVPVSFSASQTSFSCADIGANTVTLTVTDSGGLTDTCTATVTVIDNLGPVWTNPGAVIPA